MSSSEHKLHDQAKGNCRDPESEEEDMRALMNLSIEPDLRLFEVSALVVSRSTQQAVIRVLKVLAATPFGAVKIVRERYPLSRAHKVVSSLPTRAQMV